MIRSRGDDEQYAEWQFFLKAANKRVDMIINANFSNQKTSHVSGKVETKWSTGKIEGHTTTRTSDEFIFQGTAIRFTEEANDNEVKQPTRISSSIADEIKKLHKLKEQGILSDEEFDTQKAKLLDNS